MDKEIGPERLGDTMATQGAALIQAFYLISPSHHRARMLYHLGCF